MVGREARRSGCLRGGGGRRSTSERTRRREPTGRRLAHSCRTILRRRPVVVGETIGWRPGSRRAPRCPTNRFRGRCWDEAPPTSDGTAPHLGAWAVNYKCYPRWNWLTAVSRTNAQSLCPRVISPTVSDDLTEWAALAGYSLTPDDGTGAATFGLIQVARLVTTSRVRPITSSFRLLQNEHSQSSSNHLALRCQSSSTTCT